MTSMAVNDLSDVPQFIRVGVYVSVQGINPQLTMMVTLLTLKAPPSVPHLSYLVDMLRVLVQNQHTC